MLSVQKVAMMLGAGGCHWEPSRTARFICDRNNGSTITEIIVRIESDGGVVTRVDRAGLLTVVAAVLGAGRGCWRPNNRARVVRGSKARFEE